MGSWSNTLPLISHSTVHVYHYNEQSRKPNSKRAYKTLQSILLFSNVGQKPSRDLEEVNLEHVKQESMGSHPPVPQNALKDIYRLPHLIHI